MIALIVIAIIVLIFAILLNCTVRAEMKYYGGKFDLQVKYLLFTIYPAAEEKEKKTKKFKKSKSSKKKDNVSSGLTEDTNKLTDGENTADGQESKIEDNASEEVPEDDELSGKKKSKKKFDMKKFSDIIEKAKIIWEFCKKPLLIILRKVYFDNMIIDFKIGGEDACEAALNYGKINAVFYNALTLLRTFFTVSVRTVDIVCDFNSKESVYDGEVTVRLKPITVINAAIVALVGYLKHKNELDSVGNDDVNSDIKAVNA